MSCPTCGFPLIPGLTNCVNCGDHTLAVVIETKTSWGTIDAAALQADHAKLCRVRDALLEARGLEIAGDTGTATAIYERLAADRCPFGEPYRRLAIIYRKATRPSDEERVVRLALAHLGAAPTSWFVLRLAKLLKAAR